MSPESSAGIPRENRRHPARIPVYVEIAHAWDVSVRRAFPGTLFNVSRGGACVQIAWVLPPRTRLHILIPVGEHLGLSAEVVWTSFEPGHDFASTTYGIRWLDYLEGEHLKAMVSVEEHLVPRLKSEQPRP
ncbi:MAG TPA: PilZ domain-containing protein [Candidatus Methylomirabilis sp.]